MGCTKTPHDYCVYLSFLIMKFVKLYVNFDEEKAMYCSLKRELYIRLEEYLLAPKQETQEVVV